MRTNPNSKKRVPVLMGNTQNSYQLLENEVGDGEIWGKFKRWNSKAKRARKIKITHNNIYNCNIFEVRIVTKDSCSEDEKTCKELQILTQPGQPNKKRHAIKNYSYCDFDKVQIVRIHFSKKEIEEGRHYEVKCGSCYNSDIQPDTSEGNIILGGG